PSLNPRSKQIVKRQRQLAGTHSYLSPVGHTSPHIPSGYMHTPMSERQTVEKDGIKFVVPMSSPPPALHTPTIYQEIIGHAQPIYSTDGTLYSDHKASSGSATGSPYPLQSVARNSSSYAAIHLSKGRKVDIADRSFVYNGKDPQKSDVLGFGQEDKYGIMGSEAHISLGISDTPHSGSLRSTMSQPVLSQPAHKSMSFSSSAHTLSPAHLKIHDSGHGDSQFESRIVGDRSLNITGMQPSPIVTSSQQAVEVDTDNSFFVKGDDHEEEEEEEEREKKNAKTNEKNDFYTADIDEDDFQSMDHSME
ncbi:hypothetical protein ADUPG1_000646, partial [Aduncisulcus paluster]